MELHNDKLIVGSGPETRTLNNPTSLQAVYGGKKNKRKMAIKVSLKTNK